MTREEVRVERYRVDKTGISVNEDGAFCSYADHRREVEGLEAKFDTLYERAHMLEHQLKGYKDQHRRDRDYIGRLEKDLKQLADHRREVDAIKADALDVSNQQRKQVADLQADLNQVSLDLQAAWRREADLRGQILEWKRALCSLTPGGSEFADDSKACVEWALDSRNRQHELVIANVKQRKDLQGQLEAARAELDEAKEELVDAATLANNASSYKLRCDDLRRANDGHRRATTHMLDELETLRGLVRALPRCEAHELGGQIERHPDAYNAVDELLEYRATLAQAQPKGEQ